MERDKLKTQASGISGNSADLIERNVSGNTNGSHSAGAPAETVDVAWNRSCSGASLREALVSSMHWLEQHTEAINALNVFPVPDGDTGTNMSRTMEAAVKEMQDSAGNSASAELVGKRLSYGALMGARGNSGVILSQIIRGLADGFSGKENFTAQDLAGALTKAREMAYRAVIKPVEGTMLTVVREAAEAAEEAARRHNNILYVLVAAVNAARESVARTPTLLPALREAGVVDAGGHGCYVLLEGALKHLRGEKLVKTELNEVEKARPVFAVKDGDEHAGMDAFGYCTNFMLHAREPLDFEEVRDKIVAMGQSAVIVGDSTMLKVHIHTEDPGRIISYATGLGALQQIKLDNMQAQHEEAFSPNQAAPLPPPDDQAIEGSPDSTSVIAVAAGDGLKTTFKNFGVSYVVQGGQTMNPSTQDLLAAVKKVPGQRVIILPNNKNIVLVAQQVASLTDKEVAVVPTATIPQGIAALSRFNYEAALAENAAAMQQALTEVQTGEVTRAVRTATVNGVSVTEGQWIGLINDVLRLAAESKEETVWQLLEKMEAAGADLLTFYSGEDVSEPEAQTMHAQVQARYPRQTVEMVWGGQPHYHYIISVE